MVVSHEYKFSIVVPTYNRREVVQQSLATIAAAEMPWPCELIVVDDGSTDGTGEALSALRLELPLRVVQQANAGAARARNRGAAQARGEFLLFLDDDMAIDPRLLVEHARSLDSGADAVVGDIPLHPDSPPTLLTKGVAAWADKRRSRLQAAQGRLTTADFLTGQLSVRTALFTDIGGFDEALTAGGSFGGEDTDFVFRLMQHTSRVRYNGAAVSYQRYLTRPEQNLRQWWEAGRADAMLSRKHSTLGGVLWDQHRGSTVMGRVTRRLSAINPTIQERLRAAIARRASSGHTDPATAWAYTRMRDVAYWSGARAGGGIVRRHHQGVRILAYHAIDRVDDPLPGRYAVRPDTFEQHVEALRANGFTFVDTDQLVASLNGGAALPDRSVLLTFDDGYESLLWHAAPVLARHSIPAVVCVVTSQLNGDNAWEGAARGATLPLLNAEQLRTLSRSGWEIAAHSHRHAHLTTLRAADLAAEMASPRAELVAAGLPEPRLIAYPYGEHDLRVRRFAQRAGYRAGLAMQGRAGSAVDRFALPRLEVRSDTDADRLLALLAEPATPACSRSRLNRAAMVLRLAMDGLDRPWVRPAAARAGAARSSDTGNGRAA
jgi:glycosyltransferase involved in cell wall biosynthesis/peptidoglycan/xylan/chitin deacetylase (PgdA/CDA1 family)